MNTSEPSDFIYEAEVPDTLDLADRARLALRNIANTMDPEDEYNMWFEIFWCSNPPYMLHSGCDVECAPKFVDALAQLGLLMLSTGRGTLKLAPPLCITEAAMLEGLGVAEQAMQECLL